MNFVIHRDCSSLKTCRTLSIPFRKTNVTDDPESGLQITPSHKHDPNKQPPSRQHIIPTHVSAFRVG